MTRTITTLISCIRSGIVLTGIALASTPGIAQDGADAQTIVDRASTVAYYQGENGRASVHMSILDAQGRERTRDFVILRTDMDKVDNGKQRFYVFFTRPADVNRTAFLVWKNPQTADDRWFYLPALDLVKRIAPSDERTSFVGSHFFYEDVSGRGPREDHHILEEETDTYYVIRSTPNDPDAVAFASYRIWIHKTTFLPIKTVFYGADGEAYRTYTATAVETIDGYPTVVRSTMEDTRIGGETRMSYTDVEYNIDLTDDIFTERYLRTPPRRLLR